MVLTEIPRHARCIRRFPLSLLNRGFFKGGGKKNPQGKEVKTLGGKEVLTEGGISFVSI